METMIFDFAPSCGKKVSILFDLVALLKSDAHDISDLIYLSEIAFSIKRDCR